MARIDHRSSTRFDQESDTSHVKYVLATVPLAVVLVMFVYEAYQRPSKPFYNLPSYVTDDATLSQAAEASGSLVPLMDMNFVTLSFSVAWAIAACYYLGFLRAQRAMVDAYLEKGKPILGNVVYEKKGWAFEFRYYGYCSYPHPDPSSDPDADEATTVRKRVRVHEPYTRELVPILYLPGYPKSGQGKDDVQYASLLGLKNKPREVFMGRLCLFWFIVCVGVAIFILRQMSIIDEAEYYAGITDEYDNVDKGWKVFWLFIGIGVFGVAIGGTALAWINRRWWLLHQGTFSMGDLSIHGFDGMAASESQAGEDYLRMSNYK